MDNRKLIVISLETAKSYAESINLHNIDEALDVVKSVYETLNKVRKDSTNESFKNFTNN